MKMDISQHISQWLFNVPKHLIPFFCVYMQKSKNCSHQIILLQVKSDVTLAEICLGKPSGKRAQYVNVAGDGKATQSSTGWNGVASRAVDGNTDGRLFAWVRKSLSHPHCVWQIWHVKDKFCSDQNLITTGLRLWPYKSEGLNLDFRRSIHISNIV